MLHIQCRGCLASAYTENGSDPDALVVCPDPAASGCCTQDHHHGQAANSCTGEHDGEHGKDNPDCTVCRPLVITVMPGSVAMQQATGG
jgi:hypothetical protein